MRCVARMLITGALIAASACGGSAPSSSSTSSTSTSADSKAASSAAADPGPRQPQSFPPADPGLFQAPQPTGEQRQKMDDLKRDLFAVAAGSLGATKDLTDDLDSLMAHPPPPVTLQNLGATLDKALRSRSLDDAHGKRLAEILYATLHLPYMPASQQEVVRAAMVQELRAVGVGEPEATAVGAVVAAVK